MALNFFNPFPLSAFFFIFMHLEIEYPKVAKVTKRLPMFATAARHQPRAQSPLSQTVIDAYPRILFLFPSVRHCEH